MEISENFTCRACMEYDVRMFESKILDLSILGGIPIEKLWTFCVAFSLDKILLLFYAETSCLLGDRIVIKEGTEDPFI